MLPRLDQVGVDLGLAEELCGFEPMQSLDKDEPLAILTDLDRRLHAVREDVLGENRAVSGWSVFRRAVGT